MKIIKKGTIPKTTKRFTCSNCGCVFECDKNEYDLHFSQRDGDWLETKCLECGTRVVRDRYVKGENNES